MQTLSDDLLVGATQAAEFLGPKFTRRMVYHLTEQGHLPVMRKGKLLFYRKSDLLAAFTPEAVAA